MPRRSKTEEVNDILPRLARDLLKYLEANGVEFDIDQTIGFYTFIKKRAAERTEAAGGNGGT